MSLFVLLLLLLLLSKTFHHLINSLCVFFFSTFRLQHVVRRLLLLELQTLLEPKKKSCHLYIW